MFTKCKLQAKVAKKTSSSSPSNDARKEKQNETSKSAEEINNEDKDDETSSVDSYAAVETIKVATEEKKEKEIQARVRQLQKIKLLYS